MKITTTTWLFCILNRELSCHTSGLETAHRNGAQTVEVDVVLTSDNEPVLFHDPTLDRTTDGTGNFLYFIVSYVICI